MLYFVAVCTLTECLMFTFKILVIVQNDKVHFTSPIQDPIFYMLHMALATWEAVEAS